MQLAYPQNDTRAETLRYLGAGGWQPDAASQVLLQKAEDALRAAADDIAGKLEAHYRDMQDMEYTIERGKLYMLQTLSLIHI